MTSHNYLNILLPVQKNLSIHNNLTWARLNLKKTYPYCCVPRLITYIAGTNHRLISSLPASCQFTCVIMLTQTP